MESKEKEVDFTYCNYCVHEKKSESEDPCWDCLNQFTNTDSHKPINYKPKNSQKNTLL